MSKFMLSVPDELHENLKTWAKTKGQTLNGLARQILWEWADSNGLGRAAPPSQTVDPAQICLDIPGSSAPPPALPPAG